MMMLILCWVLGRIGRLLLYFQGILLGIGVIRFVLGDIFCLLASGLGLSVDFLLEFEEF